MYRWGVYCTFRSGPVPFGGCTVPLGLVVYHWGVYCTFGYALYLRVCLERLLLLSVGWKICCWINGWRFATMPTAAAVDKEGQRRFFCVRQLPVVPLADGRLISILRVCVFACVCVPFFSHFFLVFLCEPVRCCHPPPPSPLKQTGRVAKNKEFALICSPWNRHAYKKNNAAGCVAALLLCLPAPRACRWIFFVGMVYVAFHLCGYLLISCTVGRNRRRLSSWIKTSMHVLRSIYIYIFCPRNHGWLPVW